MEKVDYLIVGGGISGLSFAARLPSGADYLIVEAEEELGGYCRTVRCEGFTWDYSGHFFHFRRAEIETYLRERMDGEEILRVERKSAIHYADRLIDFPFQKNIHQLPKAEFIEALYDLYFREPNEESNFYEMLISRFGRAIAEKFLIPYNEKLYATDLRRLDRDAMGRFFPHADLDEIVRNFREPDASGYNQTFTYPRGGAIRYVEALARDLDSTRILKGEPVIAIDLERSTARTEERTFQFKRLISSMPLDRLYEIASIPYNRELYQANEVEVFNLGFDRKGPEAIHWIYYPNPTEIFYRVGFYDNIFGDDRMSLYVEIGRRRQQTPEDWRGTLDKILNDLSRVGIVQDHELIAHHRVVLSPAYVHINQAVIRDSKEKRAALGRNGVHSIGRYGAWTYCSIEDNIIEAFELADRLSADG